MVKAKKFIYAKAFDGLPKENNFKLETEELPALKDGEILLEAIFLSVDPYMRAFAGFQFQVGDTMIGTQVAKVKESKNSDFPFGVNVLANVGWRTLTVSKGDRVEKLPEYPPDVPISLALGVLGLPGRTASYGISLYCEPKAGETVAISSGAGAVGSVAGQLAKMQGCVVIGLAGSEEKVKYMKELGFDHAINYKKVSDLNGTLWSAAPKGIDCFIDCVGGKLNSAIMQNMREDGRVAQAGAISQYNLKQPELVPAPQRSILRNRLKIQGFNCLVCDVKNNKAEQTEKLIDLVKNGKLKYRETVTNGFENMPKALINLLTGTHTFGKAIVKV